LTVTAFSATISTLLTSACYLHFCRRTGEGDWLDGSQSAAGNFQRR